MSSMKDAIKAKVRSSAHTQLIDTNITEYENVNENVNVNRKRKLKFEETHKRATFYIENSLLEKLNKMSGSEKGEKTRIINDALRQYFNS